uniref:Uncharacterized protein n=1 Tax=Arundo donax TaxID=35708 RepID=A0A0A9DLA5_ARUDO
MINEAFHISPLVPHAAITLRSFSSLVTSWCRFTLDFSCSTAARLASLMPDIATLATLACFSAVVVFEPEPLMRR